MLKRSLSNQKGMAVFEMIPIIIVVVLLMNFALGFFGAIHTGILQSIAARNYALETYRHRANVAYFHPLVAEPFTYTKDKVRYHGVVTSKKNVPTDKFVASTRPIDRFAFGGNRLEDSGATKADHSTKVQDLNETIRNENVAVNPIWIKTGYGMCLNAACKP